MRVNVLENELVPEHIILNEEEANQVLENLKIRVTQLPKILSTDPALKALNKDVELGTIIKIIRKSVTAGDAITYRVVIEG